MKKAFAISGLTVWTLGLVIGLGFAVVGQMNGTNKLPFENRRLQTENRSLSSERDSLRVSLKTERGLSDQYLGILGLHHKMLFEVVTPPNVTSLRPRPREE